MLKAKIVSSLVKAFADEGIDAHSELKRISALRGERVHFQLIYTDDEVCRERAELKINGTLAKHTSVRCVMNVPVNKPLYGGTRCKNFLRRTPGMYPDVLVPMRADGLVTVYDCATMALFFEVNIPKAGVVGESVIEIKLTHKGKELPLTLTVDVIDAIIPENELYFTQWFHYDCLASYYNVDVFSEEHWRIIENFVKTAVKNGINLLLTPIFTPPLDTARGGERKTVQLVKVILDGGKYSFDFTLLDRFVDLADRCGIKYFEISHLFTQWGAEHAPKIMATADGEYKKIFGWETDAHGEEYARFLRTFLPQFLRHMRARGDDKRCFFHISDEPTVEQLESYRASKAIVADMLEGYTIMDALSSYDFYSRGIVETPIPATNHIEPFIKNGTENLWTYYCCMQYEGTSNRFIAMPAYRNRSIGMQMYKYNIVGFLQWGYNFYNNQHSANPINPYLNQDGDSFVPAGDMYSVYPAEDGTAYESTRICVFFDALQDIAAMRLCEKYYKKGEIVDAIERAFGGEIRFDVCATSEEQMLRVRECVNEMIRKANK